MTNEKIIRFVDLAQMPKEKVIGKTIEVMNLSEYEDVHFAPKLKGVVLNIVPYEESQKKDSCFEIILDFSPFEKENKKNMPRIFYDKEMIPCLTWIESPYYDGGKDNIFVPMYAEFYEERDNENTIKII